MCLRESDLGLHRGSSAQGSSWGWTVPCVALVSVDPSGPGGELPKELSALPPTGRILSTENLKKKKGWGPGSNSPRPPWGGRWSPGLRPGGWPHLTHGGHGSNVHLKSTPRSRVPVCPHTTSRSPHVILITPRLGPFQEPGDPCQGAGRLQGDPPALQTRLPGERSRQALLSLPWASSPSRDTSRDQNF